MHDPLTPRPVAAATANLFGEEIAPADGEKAKTRKKKQSGRQSDRGGLEDGLPPNLGKPLTVEVPDFADPNRPKTCLEIDFPMVPINALSALEGNAGKPIYQMSKWWARRRSCVFRALLLAAAMKAPVQRHPDGQPVLGPDGEPVLDEDAASQAVWEAYYANHQKAGNFKHLKVLDPFMGGGTTLVEGSRLGFQVTGVDLNPVAWFVVKNELACTDPAEVKAFFDQIEAEVKPQIQPFYVTDGVGGRKGRWFKVDQPASPGSGGVLPMPEEFDPIMLPPEERKAYRYEGPEIIYTFWAKHGPCSKPGCNHRTPIFRSPVVATKKLGVKYIPCTCKNKACATVFHAELGDARIAPDAEHVVLDSEHPYTVVSSYVASRLLSYNEGGKADRMNRIHELSQRVEAEPGFNCPNCGTWSGQSIRDVLAMHRSAARMSHIDKKHLGILPVRNAKKPVYCTLLIDPEWLKGSAGVDGEDELGGYMDAPVEATEAWYRRRLENLRLIEVRGNVNTTAGHEEDASGADASEDEQNERVWLPPSIVLSSGRVLDTRAETIARKASGKVWDSHFVCAACGTPQDFRLSLQRTRRTAPVVPYALQVYDLARDANSTPYGARYFKAPDANDVDRIVCAEREWALRKDADLDEHWPRDELPFTYMTHQANFALPEQGYTHWYKMFNPRQLVVHAVLLKAIVRSGASQAVMHHGLGAVQQYLRNQNMFCIWDISRDCMAPFLSNSNYAPKMHTIENPVFGAMGRGNWTSTVEGVNEGLQWAAMPWDIAPPEVKDALGEPRLPIEDPILPGAEVLCGASSEPRFTEPFDLVITDPPFGDNIYYSDLSNFFYAWLRLPLKNTYPDHFSPVKTPSAQEALKPRSLNDADGDKHYYDRLTPCWAETCRVMKDGGIMAFTFHHSDDAQWEIVLRSLFESGLVLEAVYPIASDEMKGRGGQFGAKGTEYDMIHVCRKRLEDPKPVSWPKMRQWVKAELSRLRPLLGSYKDRGLSDADIRVILRGKALEFFSRHYGQVLVSAPGGEGTPLSIRDALLGINQLLDESSGQPGERPPTLAQPVVYQFLRLFGSTSTLSRDEVSKLLRGTAVQQRDFAQHGWVSEEAKVVRRVPIYERFLQMRLRSRRELKTELDQAHFLIGAAMPPKAGDTAVNIERELARDTFLVRPGVEALLDWYSNAAASGRAGEDAGVPAAASIALQLLRAAFEARRARMRQEDPMLFEEWESAAAV